MKFEKLLELLKNESHLIDGWSGTLLGGGGGKRLESSLQRGEEAIVHERLASVTSAGEGELDAKRYRDIDVKSVTGKIYYYAPLSLGEVVSAIFENSCNTHHNEQQPLSIVIPSDSDGIQSINNQIKLQGETMNNLTETVYSPLTTHNSLKKSAFTLTEVLITLGIIGVIAAITMPLLISEHQKKQTVVQLRKTYSELQNAIKLSEIDNGPMSEWNFPEKCASDDPEEVKPFIEKYYLPYFKNAKLVKSPYKVSIGALFFVRYWVILDNGTIFGLHSCIGNDYIWLFVDLNGVKGPNKVGRDIFVFDAYKYGGTGQNKYKLSFWGSYWDRNSVEKLKKNKDYGCNKTNTDTLKNFHCGRLIELNNWEIPADYPW